MATQGSMQWYVNCLAVRGVPRARIRETINCITIWVPRDRQLNLEQAPIARPAGLAVLVRRLPWWRCRRKGKRFHVRSFSGVWGWWLNPSFPAFTSTSVFVIAGRGICYSTKLRDGCNDFAWLVHTHAVIDGQVRYIKGVEHFAHMPPWRKGEPIGLLVEGDTPCYR